MGRLLVRGLIAATGASGGRTIGSMLDPAPDPARRDDGLDPDAVARTSFGTQFRGFDQDEVRVLLMKIADELRAGRKREARLGARLAVAEEAAARRIEPAELDEAALTAALGEETARVLAAVRAAAVEIRTKAEENAARLIREAHDAANRLRGDAQETRSSLVQEAQDEANRLRAEAHVVLDRRVEEAESAARALVEAATTRASSDRADAEQVLAGAMTDAERIRSGATAEVDAARTDALAAAEAKVEEARERGRALVREAQVVRKQVLDELAFKRRAARDQLERLRAGRERLLESYAVVRRTLEEATGELDGALDEARLAAEAAARRLSAEDWPVANGPAGAAVGSLQGPVALPAPVTTVLDPPEPVEVETALSPAPAPAADSDEPALSPELDGPSAMVADDESAAAAAVPASVDDEGAGAAAAPVEDSGLGAGAGPTVAVDVSELFARLRATVPAAVEVEPPIEVPIAPVPPSPAGPGPDGPEPTRAPLDGMEQASPVAAPGERGAAQESILERRDALTDDIEGRLVRRLKRVLADEQNEVLDALRRHRDLDALLPEVAEHRSRYAGVASQLLGEAVRAGASFEDAGPGGRGTEADVSDASDLAEELASAVVGALRSRVEEVGKERAGDDDALAEGVRACYREWRTVRIGEAARHAVLVAFNRGVYDATSLDTCLQWLVDDGGTPCPDAEDNALAGPVPRGEPFPTGHLHPPAHPGCRCAVVRVIMGADASASPTPY